MIYTACFTAGVSEAAELILTGKNTAAKTSMNRIKLPTGIDPLLINRVIQTPLSKKNSIVSESCNYKYT